MKYIYGIFILSVLSCALATTAAAQGALSDRVNEDFDRAASLPALIRAAAASYENGDYYTALKRYGQILRVEPLNVTALKGYGSAALGFSALDSAAVAFQRLVDNKLTAPDGMPYLQLAEVKYRMGQYQEAKDVYYRFLFTDKPAGATPEMMDKAQKGMEDCDWALGRLKNPLLDQESFAILDTVKINTKNYSEFSPFPVGDSLYFSAYRFPYKKDKNVVKRELIKVMTATPMGDTIAADLVNFNEENTHTAHVTFNEAQNTMYFCKCEYINLIDIQCKIYTKKKKDDNTWGDAEKLPDHINVPGYTTTEPSIAKVPGTNNEILYFASDMPGGKGQRDIWCASVTSAGYSQPENLSFNTTADDVTPFFHNATNTLYYSTEGLQTMGGFDIFKTKKVGNTWDSPDNIGAPFNSGANDVFYVLNQSGKIAYMASNRRGDFNISEEGCCYDIYKANYIKPQMIAFTYNRKDQRLLPYTTMTLYELDANGRPGPGKEVKIDESSSSRFDLLPGKKYMILAQKDRFSPDTVRFSTPKTIWKEEIVQNLFLTPAEVKLIATVYDRDTKLPIPGATARLVDIGQILPSGSFATGKGGGPLDVKEATHPEDNRYDYPLQYEHRYKVVASKPGYTIDSTETISTEGLNGNIVIEKKLYIRRGLEFKAHALNNINRDTLHGVTFRLLEIPDEKLQEEFINPLDKNFQTTVSFDKRFMIVALKDGYSSDTVEFTTKNLPKLNFQSIQRELRLRPLYLNAYLPIRLYYDNDEPDKRTMARTTTKEYLVAYRAYYNRKAEFVTRYTSIIGSDEKVSATAELDQFFEKEVRGGWERLMQFSEVLYEMLQRGDKIEITLTGFASPRAASGYNLNLTARRVSSVLNHFLIFDGGIYKSYVQSGQLTIKEAPKGDKEAPTTVSEDIKDERNSIYSVPASRERRLEIIGVDVTKSQFKN